MFFGLVNAPSTFQRLMDGLLFNFPFVEVCLNDVVIFSSSLEEHFYHIREVVTSVGGHSLKIKASKCEFAKKQVSFVDHTVDMNGVRVDPKKVDVIQNTSKPTNYTKLLNFVGIASYYQGLILRFASISALSHAASTAQQKFKWTKEMENTFRKLGRAC